MLLARLAVEPISVVLVMLVSLIVDLHHFITVSARAALEANEVIARALARNVPVVIHFKSAVAP